MKIDKIPLTYFRKFGYVIVLFLFQISQSVMACEDVIFGNGFENQFQIQITVNGLGNNTTGRTLVLQLNNNESLSITTDGTSTFCTTLPNNINYQVNILTQPQSGNSCTLNNNSGIINANTIISANCGPSQWDEMNWDEGQWN